MLLSLDSTAMYFKTTQDGGGSDNEKLFDVETAYKRASIDSQA